MKQKGYVYPENNHLTTRKEMINKMFKGSMVALVTPFKDGRIDEDGLRRLVDFQLENSTDVICPCGTTGESATLSFEEHRQVIETVVKAVDGRVPVLAGTGSNNTSEAVMLTRHAKEAGASGCLLITPYYNKPTQEGLFIHYKKIANEVDIPLVLYNVPGRTGVNMEPETVARLSKIKTIVGIKEASGSLAQISDIISLSADDFNVISGDDINALPLLAVGGKGVISVTANIAPQLISSLVKDYESGNLESARSKHLKLLVLNKAMFLQTNPIPVKTALGIMGIISPELRLPMCSMPDELVTKLGNILKTYKLI